MAELASGGKSSGEVMSSARDQGPKHSRTGSSTESSGAKWARILANATSTSNISSWPWGAVVMPSVAAVMAMVGAVVVDALVINVSVSIVGVQGGVCVGE